MRVAGAKVTCQKCGELHEVLGTPGHKVTAEWTCDCGQRLVITADFSGAR